MGGRSSSCRGSLRMWTSPSALRSSARRHPHRNDGTARTERKEDRPREPPGRPTTAGPSTCAPPRPPSASARPSRSPSRHRLRSYRPSLPSRTRPRFVWPQPPFSDTTPPPIPAQTRPPRPFRNCPSSPPPTPTTHIVWGWGRRGRGPETPALKPSWGGRAVHSSVHTPPELGPHLRTPIGWPIQLSNGRDAADPETKLAPSWTTQHRLS